LAIADGIGLILAAKLLNKQKKQKLQYWRLSGADLMMELCYLAAAKKWRIFLLGGEENVAKKASFNIKKLVKQKINKNLEIDYYSGSNNINKQTEKQLKQTIEKINKYEPQLLFVAFGAPLQEKWIADNLKKLKVKMAMGVGGSFNYLSGKMKRASLLWRKIGLEWLWRLLKEPWRWRRQLALFKFSFLVLKDFLKKN